MRKRLGGLICILLPLLITNISWKPAHIYTPVNNSQPITAKELLDKYTSDIYQAANLEASGLSFFVFKKAITGYLNLKAGNKLPQNSPVLSVIDYTKPSHEKRMWIIDIINKQLVLNTWVAHGQGSGDDMAIKFSDKVDSHKSSLGFYITDDVYYGKNGRSLKLDGMDAGFNINARARAIVLHGAEYVGQSIIDEQGRIGRSFGCPAVSAEVADMVIETLKNKTVMFINGNNGHYTSKYLDEDAAANFVTADATAL